MLYEVITRELLDYAAPAHLTNEPCDPLEALREALALLEQQQALREHRLEVAIPESIPRVSGSHAKLVQVFVITSYSIHYTKLYESAIMARRSAS